MKSILEIYESLAGALTGGAIGTVAGGIVGNTVGHNIEDKVNTDIDTTGKEIAGKIDAGKNLANSVVDQNTIRANNAIDAMQTQAN